MELRDDLHERPGVKIHWQNDCLNNNFGEGNCTIKTVISKSVLLITTIYVCYM